MLIKDKEAEIFENWEELTQRADNRKTNLEQSRELQRFLADLRDLVSNSILPVVASKQNSVKHGCPCV